MDKHTFVINSAVILFNYTNGLKTYLVIKRSMTEDKNPGKWGIPGGKLDAEDGDVFKGLRREILEETGITLVSGLELIESHMASNAQSSAGTENKLYMTFDGMTPFENATIKLSDEHTEFKWVTKQQLRSDFTEEDFTPNTYNLLLTHGGDRQ